MKKYNYSQHKPITGSWRPVSLGPGILGRSSRKTRLSARKISPLFTQILAFCLFIQLLLTPHMRTTAPKIYCIRNGTQDLWTICPSCHCQNKPHRRSGMKQNKRKTFKNLKQPTLHWNSISRAKFSKFAKFKLCDTTFTWKYTMHTYVREAFLSVCIQFLFQGRGICILPCTWYS